MEFFYVFYFFDSLNVWHKPAGLISMVGSYPSTNQVLYLLYEKAQT